MTETAVAKAPAKKTTKAAELTVAEIITSALNSDEQYQAAIEKLRDLETSAAQVQSQYDQATAAATDTEELASRILSGDTDLSDQEQVFAKRQVLGQKLEAFRLAISQQREIVNNRRIEAGSKVQAAVEPIYRERLARVLAGIEELETSVSEWAEISQNVSYSGLAVSFNFYGLQALTQSVKSMKQHAERHRLK